MTKTEKKIRELMERGQPYCLNNTIQARIALKMANESNLDLVFVRSPYNYAIQSYYVVTTDMEKDLVLNKEYRQVTQSRIAVEFEVADLFTIRARAIEKFEQQAKEIA